MQNKSQKLFDEKNTLNLWLLHEERHLKTKKKNYYMQVFLTLICYGTKNIRWFLRSFEGFKTFIDALLRDRTQIG